LGSVGLRLTQEEQPLLVGTDRVAEAAPGARTPSTTVPALVYDPVTGNLHYVNAGHEPPFVIRHTGRRSRTIRLESGGPVLGLARRPSYRERVLPLNPGDLFVAYTDGVCEAASPQGEEWGWRRFLEAIQSGERLRVRDTVERVWEAVDRFTAGSAPFDDMTLWMARVDEAEFLPLPRRAESLELVAA
jgi:sigma-B regulation protein RsbU (phosphoserine phosphatase)